MLTLHIYVIISYYIFIFISSFYVFYKELRTNGLEFAPFFGISFWVVNRLCQGLNAAPLLRATPHPLGTMAQEELRGSGGFEQQWPVGGC